MRETGEENRTKKSIDKKSLKLNEEIWEKNQKIIDIVNEKIFQPGLKTEKEKPRFVVRKKTWSEYGAI